MCFSAFAVFDQDGDGRITLDELKQSLGPAMFFFGGAKEGCIFVFVRCFDDSCMVLGCFKDVGHDFMTLFGSC